MQVIGHRGVRNIETENTLAALKKSADYGVDAVEFDVRLTKDKVPVLCHNRNLRQIYGVNKNVDELSFDEARKLTSKKGEPIPSLEEILKLGIKKPLMLDIKSIGSAKIIYKIMAASKAKWMVTTYLHEEAADFKKLEPTLFISLSTFTRPLKTIKMASNMGINGVTTALYLLNPLTYRRANSGRIQLIIYQNYLPVFFNQPFFVKIWFGLYPKIAIFTDRADKIVPALKASK